MMNDFLLNQLTHLTVLQLSMKNRVTNHSLSKLTNLKELDYVHQGIISNETIGRLTNLESLIIRPHQEDIMYYRDGFLSNVFQSIRGPLRLFDTAQWNLHDLTTLKISFSYYVGFTDFSLKRLVNLRTLALKVDSASLYHVKDNISAETINGLTGLTRLTLKGMNYLNNETISSLTNLKQLKIQVNHKISRISHLTNLERIILYNFSIKIKEEFNSLTKLKSIKMLGMNNEILSFLSNDCDCLDLSCSPEVSDVGLMRFTNLTSLHANRHISDHVVSTLTKLSFLDMCCAFRGRHFPEIGDLAKRII